MPNTIDEYRINLVEEKERLCANIKDISITPYLTAGSVLVFAGIVLTVIGMCFSNFLFGHALQSFESRDDVQFTLRVLPGLVFSILGAFCFYFAKSAGGDRDKYQEELIVLRDLLLTIELSDRLSDSFEKEIPQTEVQNGRITTVGKLTIKESPKSNAQKDIIAALIDRCSA